MGTFEPTQRLDDDVRAKLRMWATELPAVQVGLSPTCQMHGYSGTWHVETAYEVYRRIAIQSPDYVALNGRTDLQIPPDGNGGTGMLYGTLQVQIGACYAELEICDRVLDARVLADGSMRLRNTTQARQLIKLDGTPPQRDGFEPEFRGAREIEVVIQCPPDEPGILRGTFSSDVGGRLYSRATGKWYR
jgi:hypothetical protein